ncbi:hypothetical protein ABES80_15420 [Bacillus gobiensis]|uniref:hypothetical protein n=1 Tax=Bacillus gobiensis TaxID=1441095 RepID=UPI003D213A3A
MSIQRSTEEFGVVGDGTDETVKMQQWADSLNGSYAELVIPGYTIKITRPITFPSGFIQPIIKGVGFDSVIDATGINNEPAFVFQGGSGSANGGDIGSFRIIGNDTTIGIEAIGVNTTVFRNIKFGRLKTGILLHNEFAGEFTEYVVAEHCDFQSACKTALEYKRTNGLDSFHGSGLGTGCTINQALSETEPKIKIGPGCLPYHSPLDINVWTRNSTPIVRNEGHVNTNFYGDQKVEIIGRNVVELVDSTKNNVYICGHFMSFSDTSRLGRAIYCDRLATNEDGTISIIRKPYSKDFALTTGSNATVKINNNITAFINLLIIGPFYEFNYTLLMYGNPLNDSAVVTVMSINRAFDQNNLGFPTLSTDSTGHLIITNPNFPASGFEAVISVNQIGGRYQYRLQ